MKFDLIVIGGGPAGYTGAIRASKYGMSVALVEKDSLGGTCLNRGCIPTKALLHSSGLYASKGDWDKFGVCAESVRYDEAQAYARKDEIVATLRGGIASLIKTGKITYYVGEGSLISAHKVKVNDEIIESDYVLIASGSKPVRIPISGAEFALTSDEALQSPIGGESVVIIGGGVIGVELATYFRDTDRAVAIIEETDKILPTINKDITSRLAQGLKRSGVKIFTSATVVSMTKNSVTYTVNGEEKNLTCDAVIMAVGRRANADCTALESLGIRTNGRYITVDENGQTSLSGVYAAGDVTGGIQLAHFAAASAVKAVAHMCGKPDSTDLTVIPSCVYTRPEIATVGNPEGAVKSSKFLLGANGKTLINGSNVGFIKLYCDDKGVVLAAELFGDCVTELLGEVALAVRNKLTAEQIAGTVHAHPTVYESVAEAAEDIFGLATHKV